MLTASGLLWFYSALGKNTALSKKNLKRIVVAGVFLGLHFTCFFWGVRHTSIANATILANTGPFFTALISAFNGKSHLKPSGYVGLFLALIGVCIVQSTGLDVNKDSLIGNLVSLLGGFFISLTYLFAEKIRITTKNVVYGRTLFFVAALTILAISIFLGENPMVFEKKHLPWFLFLGLVPSIFGHNFLNYAIKYLSPTAIASIPLGEPIIASFLGYILFYEKISNEAFLGSPFVFIGIYLILKNSNK